MCSGFSLTLLRILCLSNVKLIKHLPQHISCAQECKTHKQSRRWRKFFCFIISSRLFTRSKWNFRVWIHWFKEKFYTATVPRKRTLTAELSSSRFSSLFWKKMFLLAFDLLSICPRWIFPRWESVKGVRHHFLLMKFCPFYKNFLACTFSVLFNIFELVLYELKTLAINEKAQS